MTFSKQDTFNTAVIGLARQNWEQSTNKYGQCFYRGEKGRKCPVGYCIDDAKYKPTFEGMGPSLVLEIDGSALGRHHKNMKLLDDMQKLHDNHPDDMKKAFMDYAEQNNLEWPL